MLIAAPKVTAGVGKLTVGPWAKPPGAYMGIVQYRPSGVIVDWTNVYPDHSTGPVTITTTAKTDVRVYFPDAGCSPVVTATPLTAPVPPPAPKLRVAVNNTTGWGPAVDQLFHGIGVRETRFDVGDGADLNLVDAALADGMRPLVSYNPNQLAGVTPAVAATQVKTLATALKARGIDELEFGNEVYQVIDAHTYGVQYAAARAAISGLGVKLLAVATAIDGTGVSWAQHATPTWIPDVLASGPVDAWTIHPYGPFGPLAPGQWGWETVGDWHIIALRAGSDVPWYITEVGVNVSNVGGDTGAQASALSRYLADTVSRFPWVVYLNWFEARDDSASGAFGLVDSANAPRPAFATLQAWLAG